MPFSSLQRLVWVSESEFWNCMGSLIEPSCHPRSHCKLWIVSNVPFYHRDSHFLYSGNSQKSREINDTSDYVLFSGTSFHFRHTVGRTQSTQWSTSLEYRKRLVDCSFLKLMLTAFHSVWEDFAMELSNELKIWYYQCRNVLCPNVIARSGIEKLFECFQYLMVSERLS